MAKETNVKEENGTSVTDNSTLENTLNENILKEREQALIESEKRLELLNEKLTKKYEELESKINALDNDSQKIQENIQNFTNTKEYSKQELINESKNVGEILSKQKKITIVIPKSELNPLEKNVPVTINGYTYNILRGEAVEVPEEVYKILKESKYI